MTWWFERGSHHIYCVCGCVCACACACACACVFLQNVPPDLAICSFILEQSLSVRALQEMLAHRVEMIDVGTA